MRSYTVEADGKVYPFQAPENASPDQLRTLAARALKQAAPGKQYQRPVLEKGLQQKITDQGSISAPKWSLSGAIEDKAASALSAFGMDEGHARRLAGKFTSALSDFTPVGSAVEGDQARQAWNEGNYLGAAGHGALAALGSLPAGGAAKAMFLGVGAKIADKVALAKAEQMAAKGLDRRAIWDETGWFQGADNKWRFEVPDNNITVSELPVGGYANRLENIVRHDTVQEAYPMPYRGALAAVTTDPSLNGSWEEAAHKLRLNPGLPPDKMRSTAAHELQHFVQGQEGFARGGAIGPIRDIPEARALQEEHDNVWEELALRLDQDETDPAIPALQARYAELSKRLEPWKYQSYRRLAGEVEARNVQTRLDMTPGQRREYAPWETEDVPRQDQFVLWHDK